MSTTRGGGRHDNRPATLHEPIPFLFGILIAPIGFYIRSQLEDTMDIEKAHNNSKSVFSTLLRSYRSELIWSAFYIVGPTVSSYIISSYMTTYAITVLKLPTSTSMLAGLVAGAVTIVGALVGVHLSDRFGRKVVTIVPQAIFILLSYPAFLGSNHGAIRFIQRGRDHLRRNSAGICNVASLRH